MGIHKCRTPSPYCTNMKLHVYLWYRSPPTATRPRSKLSWEVQLRVTFDLEPIQPLKYPSSVRGREGLPFMGASESKIQSKYLLNYCKLKNKNSAKGFKWLSCCKTWLFFFKAKAAVKDRNLHWCQASTQQKETQTSPGESSTTCDRNGARIMSDEPWGYDRYPPTSHTRGKEILKGHGKHF